MSRSTVQIWEVIQDSGVASTADCQQWAGEIHREIGDEALDNPQLLLAQLVKRGRLTPFQANALLADEVPVLAIGAYRLLGRLESRAMRDWYEAVEPSRDERCWLYAIAESRLLSADLADHPPSLQLARQQASIRGDGLQVFSLPLYLDGSLLIASSPAPGRPLRDFLTADPRGRMNGDIALSIVRQLAESLALLHSSKIVHGQLGVDCVWWDGASKTTLLRDPLFPPVNPLSDRSGCALRCYDDMDSKLRSAAPEFAVPGQTPTFATDLYALGCLWWELILGKLPFEGTSANKILSAAAKTSLTIPPGIGLSPDQAQCLRHLLAKNPSARFSNASQFLAALRAAEEATEVTKSEPTATATRIPPATASKPPTTISASRSDPTNPSRTLDGRVPEARKDRAAAPPVAAPIVPPVAVPIVPPVAAPIAPVAPIASTAPVPATPARPLASAAPLVPAASATPAVQLTDTKGAATIESPGKPAKKNPNKKAPATGGKRGKKKSRPVWLIPAMLGTCLAVLGGLIGILNWRSESRKRSPSAANSVTQLPTVTSPSPPPAGSNFAASPPRVVDPIEDQFVVAKDNDNLPWVPPHPSQPYSLVMLPAGAQGFIFVRPQKWRANGAGTAILQALAPVVDPLWSPLEKSFGVSLDAISELTVGLYGGRSDGWPTLAYRLQLTQPTTIEKLKERIANGVEQLSVNQRRLIVVGDQACYLYPAETTSESMPQYLSVGSLPLIKELAEMDGAAPLRRQMEQLWQVSDAQSDLSLLLGTGFFFADARNILPSISPRVQNACRELFDEKAQAILITTSLSPQWYGEMRVVCQTSDETARIGKMLQERMKSIADTVEDELVRAPASPYWRALAARYPQMLRALTRYLRYGVENGQAIANFYLPEQASANLTIATWMAAQQASASPSATPVATAQPTAEKRLTGDDLLGHPVSINFEQEALDAALSLIAEEVNRSLPAGTNPIALSIDGKAFELASVTRNQQIRDFRFKDQPLRALLVDLASRVNPDRTVKSLDEEKQAVIWILNESDGKANILFTTRRGIEGKDVKLPKEFSKPASP